MMRQSLGEAVRAWPGQANRGVTPDTSSSVRGEPAPIGLRLLATSDLHGHLMAHDYGADRPQPGVGLLRTASLIAQARDETANSLLIDNGDFLFGNMLADAWVTESVSRAAHPMIAAMNALRYDAVGLGNHEFNFGLEVLAEALAPATFPVLCANVTPLHADVPFRARPGMILRQKLLDEDGQAQDLAIGLVSVLPPQVMQWDAAHLAGRVAAGGMLDAVRHEAAALRAAGADVVIVMNHSGLGDGTPAPEAENAGLAIARLPGVDVVLCGHRHQLFPGPHYEGREDVDAQAGTLAGVPAAMPGCWGSHLAVLDLELTQGNAGWHITRHRTELRAIARRVKGTQLPRTEDAPDLAAIAAPVHHAARASMDMQLGHVDHALHTYFSRVGPCPVSALVAAAQACGARRIVGDTDLPLLSAVAPFRCGGTGGPENFTDLPAGPVRLRDIGAIYPYPNALRVLRVTGAQVTDWLEQVAAQFHRLLPGRPDQALLDDSFPSYNFDILHGLTYRFDLSQPARFDLNGNLCDESAHRLRDIRWQGAAIDPAAEFLVATNSYRAHGGGNFVALTGADIVVESDQPVPALLLDFLRAGQAAPDDYADVWRFVPLPGLHARFRSGSGALAHMGAGICPDGLDDDGFARFILHL